MKNLDLKTFAGVFILATLGSSVVKQCNDTIHSNDIKRVQTEVKTKDYNRYVRCLEDLNSKKSNFQRIDDLSYWEKQAKKMNDSLRMDSIAKTAYEKGLRAAKDSARVVI